MSTLKKSNYEPLLKEDLVCFHCQQHQKNVPSLKSHLKAEWEKLEKKAKDKAHVEQMLAKKRKRDSTNSATQSVSHESESELEVSAKRRQTGNEE
jgi:aprataxin